jgi:tyrosinase
VRKDIAKLTPDEVETYRLAIALMKREPAESYRSWEFQSAVHGHQFSGPNPDVFNTCQHTHWWFLPWHRMYLYYVEGIMQALLLEEAAKEKDKVKRAELEKKARVFALPYWNYLPEGEARRLPEPFRQPADHTNPLFESRRGAGINEGGSDSELPASAVDLGALCNSNFYSSDEFGRSFGGRRVEKPVHLSPPHTLFDASTVENSPHNTVHLWVGASREGADGLPPYLFGFMGHPNYAALDPIFWLHHANIDRLWEKWLALSNHNPTDPAWLDQYFLFYDEYGVRRAPRVREFLDIANIAGTGSGYYYDAPAQDTDLTAFCKTRPQVQEAIKPQDALKPKDLPKRRNVLVAGRSAEVEERPMAWGLDATREVPRFKLGTKSEVLTVKIPEDNRERVTRATGTPGQPKLSLIIEGITFDRQPGAYYEVYLNQPEGQQPDPKSPGYVGTLTFFSLRPHGGKADLGGHAGHGDRGDNGSAVRLDISGTAEQLRKEGRWKADEVRITFVRRAPGKVKAEGLLDATFRNATIVTAE